MLWNELTIPWQRCLDEAWAAYQAGSIPIGAVIVDEAGGIVATGRNRIFEMTAPPPFLAGHRLAHAEINALVSLDRTRAQPRDCTLYTTTEPCPLCTGAIRMERLREVRYASRDTVAGSIALLDASPFMRRRDIQVYGPARSDLEAIIVAMHVAFSLRADPSVGAQLATQWAEAIPDGVALGQQLHRTATLQRLGDAAAPTAEMIGKLEALLH